MEGVKLVYDPTVPVSYGMWVCHECGAGFYGGGDALHNKGCSRYGDNRCAGLEFHFGPTHVEKVKEVSTRGGVDREWYGLTMRALQEQFPELL